MEIEDIYKDLPTLETERLILRKITLGDVEDIYSYASNEEVTKYVSWNTHSSLSATQDYVNFIVEQYENKKIAPWGIELKGNQKLVGTIDFVWWQTAHKTAEIGYVLSHQHWGKGITAEAAKGIIKFGFEKMDLIRIQARCFVENKGSERVMEKVGMCFEGVLRKGMFIKGKHRDLKMYSILKEEFKG